MGTNFFWETPDGEQYHIGKRSGAGGGLCSFSLQGHRDTDMPVDTWAKWKQIILLPTSKVVDEYGHEHDPAAFIAEVESTTVENRRRQYDWIRDHQDDEMRGWYGVIPEGITPPANTGDEWLCPDGFSFNYREFS